MKPGPSLLILTLFLHSGLLAAEEPAAPGSSLPRVAVETEKTASPVRIGDSLAVTLQGATLPPGSKLKAGGGLKEGYRITEDGRIAALRPGDIQVPALPVVDSQGNPVAETDPFVFNAQSTLKPEEQGAAKPPEPEPAAGPQSLGLPAGFQISVGLLFTLIMGLIVYRLLGVARKKLARKPLPEAPPDPADTVAMKRFSRIESERYYEKGQQKRHAFEISETLKGYFSDRYDIDARESTTSEMMGKLADLKVGYRLTDEDLRLVQDIFSVLDLVKFTDYRPEPSECVAQLEDARKIVQRTRATHTPVMASPSPERREGVTS